jgi:UTP--glucose-1-phosphate uridylyltransferase
VEIRKAIITAAGANQRTLPLQTLVDRDGATKTALAVIIEEALKAGIEEIAVVIQPGDEAAYRAAAGQHAPRLQFLEQKDRLGYGHAIWLAKEFTAGKPALLMVGDHVYLSRTAQSCAQQLVELASREECIVSAVQATHESKLPYYGAIGGHLTDPHGHVYQVDAVIEKPTPTEAEQRLIVPGLRAGHYLCFFGMHVLTLGVFNLLDELVGLYGSKGGVHLSPALAKSVRSERYLALEIDGRRYDIGHKYGLLTAQLALALSGGDRDEVLTGIVDLLANR